MVHCSYRGHIPTYPRCEPWCWNMNPYTTGPSISGVSMYIGTYTSTILFASGYGARAGHHGPDVSTVSPPPCFSRFGRVAENRERTDQAQTTGIVGTRHLLILYLDHCHTCHTWSTLTWTKSCIQNPFCRHVWHMNFLSLLLHDLSTVFESTCLKKL